MKTKNGAPYFLGGIVILCSLVLLGAMTYALAGASWSAGGRTLRILFPDATGIKLHSVVRYAGKPAGTVTEIRYLSNEERAKPGNEGNAVEVTVSLENEVPPLLESVTARLDAETLLGEKFVALVPGPPGARALADAAVIQGAEVSSIDAVARSANQAIASVNEILTSLKADYPDLVPKVADLLEKGNSILGQGSNLVNHADHAILNANDAVTRLRTDYADLVPQLKSLFGQAQAIATNAELAMVKVNALADRLDGVVKSNEGDLHKIFQELRVVSQDLKVISTYTKSLAAQLAERPSTLIWGRKKNPLPTEQEIIDSREPVATERGK
jgi:ABC-type transporter Mla subunit MlaD